MQSCPKIRGLLTGSYRISNGRPPRSIHVDNAREFHSDVLVRGCQEYGIQLDHRPVGVPTLADTLNG
jgi:transposase InsO family protein